jgi:hypothetical protein
MMMQHFRLVLLAALVAGCGDGRADLGHAGSKTDSAAGAVSHDSASVSAAPVTTGYSHLGDQRGRIPILEYHIIGDSSKGMFVITRDEFRRDLRLLYERGYRPMTVAQLVARDFSTVPAGMSPVVFTFDDASPQQFLYVERNGRLEIDPNSAVGIWLDFARRHPDWKGKATFCLLSGAESGHAFFGDKERFFGQKKEWRFQKVRWLAENGFELCNHTLWHAQLSKYPDAFVQEQIARLQVAIDSAVPGYKPKTMALPQGLWPKNRELAWRGSWRDPKTGLTTSYDHATVLEVAGGPARSPFDPAFDSRKLPRVIAYRDEVRKTLDRLDNTKTRFVWSGGTAERTSP